MKKLILASVLALGCLHAVAADVTAGAPAKEIAKKDKTLLTIVTKNKTTVIKDSEFSQLKFSQFKTSHPWGPSASVFEGPLLRDFFTKYGIQKTDKLTIEALDGYKVQFPASEAWKEEAILVRKMDGKLLTVANKGPSWIVFNFDKNAKIKTDAYYSLCPWQIKSITVN